MLNEIFRECIPDFTYEVIRLHDYNNEELLKRGDEMSLIMMFIYHIMDKKMDDEDFVHTYGRPNFNK